MIILDANQFLKKSQGIHLMKRMIPTLFALSIGFTAICSAEYVQPNIQHDPYGMQSVAYQMNTGDDQG